jgi:hypothetical protein
MVLIIDVIPIALVSPVTVPAPKMVVDVRLTAQVVDAVLLPEVAALEQLLSSVLPLAPAWLVPQLVLLLLPAQVVWSLVPLTVSLMVNAVLMQVNVLLTMLAHQALSFAVMMLLVC